MANRSCNEIVILQRISELYSVVMLRLTATLGNATKDRLISRCLINCKPEVSPSVKLSIKSQCHGPKCSKISSYKWILYQEYPFTPDTTSYIIWLKKELEHITDTPLNSGSIVIQKDSFEGGKNYRLAHFYSNMVNQE
ncbi:uncharacterized protein LOC144649887 [Oculina patagonica]